MPMYLVSFSMTPESWTNLIQNPEDRRKAISAAMEGVGGKLHGYWYAFGEYDGYCLLEAPDNVTMASVSLVTSASGALSALHTTVLMSVEDTISALKKAGSIPYRAPGSQ